MTARTRRELLRDGGRAALGLAGLPALLRAAAPPAKPKPNILFVLVDDLGWADLSCYGSTYHQSPIIDKLASQGMRFTDAYAAAPVCSPTRASLMTGKYPARLHLTDFIPGHWRPWAKLVVPKIRNALPLEEVSLAEALKPAGYTCGYIGKWHLGPQASHGPARQGFDFVGRARNRKDKLVGGFTDEAIRFIETNKDRPFLLYLSHHTVHIPLAAPADLIARHRSRLKPGQAPPAQANPAYAAMIEHLDRSMGRILAALDKHRLADRTIVVFYSDNGGLIRTYTGKGRVVTSNAPLRSEKGTLYEGGIRVPLIVRWPGVVEAGSVCRTPVTSMDLFPTILAMAGASDKLPAAVDGVSLMPLLKGAGRLEREAIYWHYPHYHHTAPCGAVRAGNHKLIEFLEDGRCELYDLAADLGEKKDLAAAMPAKAAELRRKLRQWRKSVGAGMPTPNADHDPAKADQWGRRRPARK
jgi:arylsulfatase A